MSEMVAYRFEYADKSAFEIDWDGRAFITWPDGRREEKHGRITNNINAGSVVMRERCAKVCINLRNPDKSSESLDWIAGTEACAAAIRALPQEGGER